MITTTRIGRLFLLPALIAGVVILLTGRGASEAAPQALVNRKLSGAMQPNADVYLYSISPDSRYVVYIADAQTDEAFELYSAPTTGDAEPVRLSGLLPTGIVIRSFAISPDSSRVVYTADQETPLSPYLYSVPIAGGEAVKLNMALPDSSVWEFRITPDGRRVAYIMYHADQQGNTVSELYAVPILGGQSVRLSGSAGGVATGSLRVSPDSSTVVFIADQQRRGVLELYSAPISGGAPVKLNGPLTPGGNVDRWRAEISPDGSRVIYLADQQTDETFELYSAPIAGGAVSKLNGQLVAGGDVLRYLISPDSSRVVYLADQLVDAVVELFSAPIAGGAVVKLNGALTNGGDVRDPDSFAVIPFEISSDSRRVVYSADQQTDEVFEIYSAPIGGGAAAKLNGFLAGDGDVHFRQISPDAARVVYVADQETDEIFELYSAPITGGAAIKVNGSLTPGGDVHGFKYLISPDSAQVMYVADQETDEIFELYGAPITGGEVLRLSGRLTTGGNIFSFLISPDSRRAIYNADQETDERLELFASFDDSLLTRPLYAPVIIGR